MRTQSLLFLAVILVTLPSSAAAAQPISTRTLLEQMTDLHTLSEYPQPPFTCRQFSSYDRKSKSPQQDWFANYDRGHFLRTEQADGRTEHVLMDAAGPGAVVRIWSANPQGTLRIYLDGESTPRLVAPLQDLLGGNVDHIPQPIAGQRSRGWNCYLPIPYAEHCKITCDEGDFYYHVNYRTYSPDTPVTSFTTAQLTELSAEIARVAGHLAQTTDTEPAAQSWLAEQPTPKLEAAVQQEFGPQTSFQLHEFTLAPSQHAELSDLAATTPAAIVALRCRVDAATLDRALRTLLFTAEFDDEQTITCPLGDFFGTAPDINPYGSVPLGITRAGVLYSRWIMPFRNSACFRIENLSDETVTLQLGVATVPYEWTARSMHFNAQWRVAYDVPTRPFIDWNYVDIDGRGVFVGAAFHLTNPVKIWWGEGDEKIYIDNEDFPSHFGTGTEDYFGYAWCSPEKFTHAYHNQPRCDGPGNYGHTSINRWHILDRIPFTEHFKFDMEIWHWIDNIKLPQISATTYWYARPDTTSNRQRLDTDLLKLINLPPYVAHRVADALEAEELPILAVSRGHASPQDITACSNETHLWWRGAGPGDSLQLSFPVPSAGRYHVFFRGVVAPDYGVIQLLINDQPAGEPIDLYNDIVTASREIPLGEFNLPVGPNRLTIKIVGTNPDASHKYMTGCDYLRLAPVK